MLLLFLQDKSMYYDNIRYQYICAKMYIFIISAGGVTLGVVRFSVLFVSSRSHAWKKACKINHNQIDFYMNKSQEFDNCTRVVHDSISASVNSSPSKYSLMVYHLKK